MTATRSHTVTPVRRRIERAAIRTQSRLEAGIGDRWIPHLSSLLLAGALIYLSLARIEGLRTGSDLAAYTQSVWLIREGQVPEPSLFGSSVHVLELHWSFVVYPLALLGLLFPVAKMLVVVQSLALGLGIVPLWRLARNVAKLRIGAASAVILAYALHPTTHYLGLEDFHPVSLAIPGLIGMAYFGATERRRWFWFCVFYVLVCRADLGLAVAVWGLIVTAQSDRRVGLWAVGVGLVWSLGFLLVAQPIMGQPGAKGAYAGQSLGEVLLVTLREPAGVFSNLIAQQNVALLIGLLAPLIFLPLLSLRHLSAGVLVSMLSLVSDVPEQISISERSAVLLAFSFIASTYALRRLGNMGVDRVFIDARLLTALAAAAVLLYSSTSPASPYERPWTWNETNEQEAAVVAAVDRVLPSESVRASPSALTLLAERTWIFELETSTELSVTQTAFPDFLDAVLLVDSDLPEQTDEQRQSFEEGMQSLGFVLRVDDDQNGVHLYVR